MADNLDSLNNISLREKCIQYGLPNVPVTDSSRKVLIRRLRTSMSASAPASKGDAAKEPPSGKQASNISSLNKQKTVKNETDTILEKKIGERRNTNYDLNTKSFETGDALRSPIENFSNNAVQSKKRESFLPEHLLSETNLRKSIDKHSRFTHINSDYVPRKSSTAQIRATKSDNFYNQAYDAVSSPQIIQRQLSKDRKLSVDESMETPYLSNFARSLERLKNDSIGKMSPSYPKQAQRDIWPEYERKSNRSDDDVGHNFNQFLIALERKYNLKRNFALIFLFLLIVFVYVFFIM